MTVNDSENSFLSGPKYLRTAARLRADIADGVWPAGAQLPVERELASALQVSVNTLRRAVAALVEEGVVRRRQGAGTFVSAPEAAPAGGGGRRLIGVLVPSTTYYYPRVVEGVRNVLREAGAQVILASSGYDPDQEREEIEALVDTGVQGLLLVPNLHLSPGAAERSERLRDLPVPYVLMERRPVEPAPDDTTSYVATDHAGGVCLALRHLRGLGHRRIGHLGRVDTGSSAAVARGFDTAAALLGLEPVAVERRTEWTPAQIDAYAAHCARERVTAVFCHGDRDAARLVVSARRGGRPVPGDLAVVAYDDEVAEVGEIPLTAVSPPKAEVGAAAARLLLDRLTGEPSGTHRVDVLPRLVVRESCGASAAPAPAAHVPA